MQACYDTRPGFFKGMGSMSRKDTSNQLHSGAFLLAQLHTINTLIQGLLIKGRLIKRIPMHPSASSAFSTVGCPPTTYRLPSKKDTPNLSFQ